jgi:hypothetical protein
LRGWMSSESTSQVEVPLSLQYLPHNTCHGQKF